MTLMLICNKFYELTSYIGPRCLIRQYISSSEKSRKVQCLTVKNMTHTINVIKADSIATQPMYKSHILLMWSENVCIIPNQEQCKDTTPTYWQVYGHAYIYGDAVLHNGTKIVNI